MGYEQTSWGVSFLSAANTSLAWSDKLVELKTICSAVVKLQAWFCALIVTAGLSNEGEQVVIGVNERYVSVCRKHYMTRWRRAH